MSAPAAKALSLPVITMAPTPSSASNESRACSSSAMRAAFRALSAFARLKVIRPTRPFFSAMMFS
jgi:hypothetical protein